MPRREEQVPWDGVGLPPAAQARVARAAGSQVAGSLLSVREAAALAAVGFTPVGDVMGCMVAHIGWRGIGCNYAYGWNDARTITSGSGDRWSGIRASIDALYRGWNTALLRLLQEATAVGADGVVGIRLSQHEIGGNNHEFLALGTAVRGNGPHATRPFTTDLSGTDVSKLLHAGWVPTGIAIGIAAAVRHDDYRVGAQRGSWSNTQVDGYTDLVNVVRHDARTQFERRGRAHGGEAVLASSMRLRIWEQEPSDGHVDHVAQATMLGSAITSFRRTPSSPSTSLTILPLNRTKETRR